MPLAANLLRRLRCERGVTLIAALGVLVTLAFTSAASLLYTSQNSGSASRSKVDVVAFALAEAGINNAVAVLANPSNDPLNRDLLRGDSASYEQGSATWSGTLDESTGIWTLSALGEFRNPTGTAPIRRKLTAKVAVEPTPTQPLANLSWNYLVATRTGNLCDMTLAADVSLSTRLLVNGNLCFSSGAVMVAGELIVKGNLDLPNRTNAVGTAATPLAAVHVVGGCKYSNNHRHPDASHPTHAFCSAADNVYGSVVNQSPPNTPVPVADWDGWYARSAPGPRRGCTSASGSVPVFDNNAMRDNSVPTQSLTPPQSYSCVVGPTDDPQAELSWDASSRTLRVEGTIFVDGSMTVDSTLAQYDGQGTLYLSGGFVLPSGTKLCATVAAGDCNFLPGGWDPNREFLAVAANGNGHGGAYPGNSAQLSSYARFQGGIYATNAVQFGGGSKLQGPAVASTLLTCNSQEFPSFPRLSTVPSGLPGNPYRTGRVGKPYDFSS